MNYKLKSTFLFPLLLSLGTSAFSADHHQNDKPLVVFHASYEAPNAKVAGVGSVVTDLLEKQNSFYQNGEKKMESWIITPYFQFLKDSLHDKVQYCGSFKHSFFGRDGVTTVYKHPTLNQYLLDPDDSIQECMRVVKTPSDIYEKSQEYARLIYWNSAVAEFANVYGVTLNSTAKPVDVVHIHSWQPGLIATLMAKKVNPTRCNQGLRPIKTVLTMHGHFHEQGTEFLDAFKHLGLSQENLKEINLAASAYTDTDMLTVVSGGAHYELCLPKQEQGALDSIFHTKQEHGVFLPIMNGVNHKNFDPTQGDVLGRFHVNSDYSNLNSRKQEVMRTLYDHGIIGDPHRSLMLYVGRYVHEKGIDLLPTIAAEWIKLGGQVVIMGSFTQDEESKKIIHDMDYFSKLDNNPYLKVYMDYQNDQNSNLSGDIPVKKGALLRFAAKWTTVPSYYEPCGLVPIEALSFGSAIFTTWVQGLGDMCYPLDVQDFRNGQTIHRDKFNSISFGLKPDNLERTKDEIRWNLGKAYAVQHEDENNWKNYQIRWCREGAQFDWLAHNGPIQQYYNAYQKISHS